MVNTLPTSQGSMTPAEIVDNLTYRVWKENREYGIKLETLRHFFGDVPCEGFERRYREEKGAAV